LCADACGTGPHLSFFFFWGAFGKPADTFVPQFFVKRLKRIKESHAPLGLNPWSLVWWLFSSFLAMGIFLFVPEKERKTALILLGCY
jgi:hypothetical protein